MCVCSCSEGSVHHTVAEVVRFVEDRIKEEEGKESHSLRGPYLARLELLHRLRERGCPEESLLGNERVIKKKKQKKQLSRLGFYTDLTFPRRFCVPCRRALGTDGAVFWEVWGKAVLHHRPDTIPPPAGP